MNNRRRRNVPTHFKPVKRVPRVERAPDARQMGYVVELCFLFELPDPRGPLVQEVEAGGEMVTVEVERPPLERKVMLGPARIATSERGLMHLLEEANRAGVAWTHLTAPDGHTGDEVTLAEQNAGHITKKHRRLIRDRLSSGPGTLLVHGEHEGAPALLEVRANWIED